MAQSLRPRRARTPANRSSSGSVGLHQELDELEVLGRPDPLLQLERDLEEEAVRVDLGRVRDQRLVADLEVLAARHPGGDPGVVGRVGLPLLEPLGVRRLQPAASIASCSATIRGRLKPWW